MNETTAIKELQQRIANYADMKAYEALYKMLFNSLYRFALSFVKSKEASEEIVSDSFVKIWQLGTKLNDIDNIKAYLFTITKNFSLNYITQNHKVIQLNITDVYFDDIITFENPEEIFMSGEIIKRVKKSINELPPQCRVIFQLVKEDGLSYKEVASILDISVFTVRNQMGIGLKKMAESLPAYNVTAPAPKILIEN
jgi:RNA polymerase sigma-70 factor (ECF subfamily)